MQENLVNLKCLGPNNIGCELCNFHLDSFFSVAGYSDLNVVSCDLFY